MLETEAQLKAKCVDATFMTALLRNHYIVIENHAFFESVEKACMTEHERREIVCLDVECKEMLEEPGKVANM